MPLPTGLRAEPLISFVNLPCLGRYVLTTDKNLLAVVDPLTVLPTKTVSLVGDIGTGGNFSYIRLDHRVGPGAV